MIERRFGRVRAVWTDRHGGVSVAPYEGANVGDRVGDDPVAVATNRRLLATRLGLGDPQGWCWLRQVHGADVVEVDAGPEPVAPTADAAVTTVVGRPLAVVTADCASVVLAAQDAVGVVHAGWQGLAAGVLEAAVVRMRAVAGGPLRAGLGPCIHPERYEFGAEDLDGLVARLGPQVRGRTAEGRPAFDLPSAVRVALGRVGVTDLDDADCCTSASADHFSYRRDGRGGRQALIAVLT